MQEKSINGKIVLDAIPSNRIKSDVTNFLNKIIKNKSVDEIAQMVEDAPVTLSKRISADHGRKIVAALTRLGAGARFEPIIPEPAKPDLTAPLASEDKPPAPARSFPMPYIKKPLIPKRALGAILAIIVLVGTAVSWDRLKPVARIQQLIASFEASSYSSQKPESLFDDAADDETAVEEVEVTEVEYDDADHEVDLEDNIVIQADSQAEKRLRKRVAVFSFISQSHKNADNQIAAGLTDLVVAQLLGTDTLDIVERDQIDTIFNEFAISLGNRVNQVDNAIKIGKMVSADIVATGSLISESKSKSLFVKTIDVPIGIIIDLSIFHIPDREPVKAVPAIAEFIQTTIHADTDKDRKFIAIGIFKDESINDRQIEYAAKIRDYLERRFPENEGTSVVARSQLKPLLLELGLNEMGMLENATDPYRKQPAVLVVDGSYRISRSEQTELEITARIKQADQVVQTLRVNSPSLESALPKLYSRLADRLELQAGLPNQDRFEEARIHFNRGRELSRLGDSIPKKHPHQSKFIGTSHKLSPARELLNLKEAISAFEAAIYLNPDYHEAMLYLAMCLKSDMIGESQRADDLFRKVLAQSKDDRLRFIAADQLGIADQVAFDPAFAEKNIDIVYLADQKRMAMRKINDGFFYGKNRGNAAGITFEQVLQAHEDTYLAECEAMYWLAQQKKGFSHRIYNITQYFSNLTQEGIGNPEIAAARDRLLVLIQQKYPRMAPHFIVECPNFHPKFEDEISAVMEKIDNGSLEPLNRRDFYSRLRYRLRNCVSNVTANLGLAKKIGEHIQAQNGLKTEEKVYLAFAYEWLGETHKGIALLETIRKDPILLGDDGPWGRLSHGAMKLKFSPQKTAAKWRRTLGEGVENLARETVKLPPPLYQLHLAEAIKGIAPSGANAWVLTDRHYGYRAESRIYKIRADRPGTIQQITVPELARQTITAIAAYGASLWIGTKNGLYEYDTQRGQVQKFSQDEGLLVPEIKGLYLHGDILYTVLGSGVGYIEQNDPARHFYGMITEPDIVDIAPSNGSIWAIKKREGLLHFAAAKYDYRVKFDVEANSLHSIAANDDFLAIGFNFGNQFGGGDQGGIWLLDLSSKKKWVRVSTSAGLPGTDVFDLAFYGRYLWIGGRGFLALVDPVKGSVLFGIDEPSRHFKSLASTRNGIWVAARNKLHFLTVDDIDRMIEAAGKSLRVDPKAAALHRKMPTLPSFDGSLQSLQKIQDKILPFARQGNIVALSICRQTMYGLSQDVKLKELPLSLGKPLAGAVIQKWVNAVVNRADQGDLFYQIVLGYLHFSGTGIKMDKQKGVDLWLSASQQGYHDGGYKIGNLYRAGNFFKQDVDKAIHYWEIAGQQGSALAFYSIGCFYNEGAFVQRDTRKAAHYWRKAAEMGHAWGQFNYGIVLNTGAGVKRDLKQSYYWMRQAAAQDLQRAIDFIAHYYEN